jgi:hypothetical protein
VPACTECILSRVAVLLRLSQRAPPIPPGIAAWSQSGDRRRHFTSPPRPPVQLVSGLPECSTSEREQLERIEEAERENRAATAELRAATEEAESVVEGIRSRGRQINQQVAQPFVLLSPRYWLLNRTPLTPSQVLKIDRAHPRS